jgi:hypothetical protein
VRGYSIFYWRKATLPRIDYALPRKLRRKSIRTTISFVYLSKYYLAISERGTTRNFEQKPLQVTIKVPDKINIYIGTVPSLSDGGLSPHNRYRYAFASIPIHGKNFRNNIDYTKLGNKTGFATFFSIK